jgi:hypothetical protein
MLTQRENSSTIFVVNGDLETQIVAISKTCLPNKEISCYQLSTRKTFTVLITTEP